MLSRRFGRSISRGMGTALPIVGPVIWLASGGYASYQNVFLLLKQTVNINYSTTNSCVKSLTVFLCMFELTPILGKQYCPENPCAFTALHWSNTPNHWKFPCKIPDPGLPMESNTKNKHKILGLPMESNTENKHKILGLPMESSTENKHKTPGSSTLKISTKLQAYHWSPALKTLGTLNIKGKLQWLSGKINLLNCKISREFYFYEMYKLFTVQSVQKYSRFKAYSSGTLRSSMI